MSLRRLTAVMLLICSLCSSALLGPAQATVYLNPASNFVQLVDTTPPPRIQTIEVNYRYSKMLYPRQASSLPSTACFL